MSKTQIGVFTERKKLKKLTPVKLTVKSSATIDTECAAPYVFIFIKKIKTVFRKKKCIRSSYWIFPLKKRLFFRGAKNLSTIFCEMKYDLLKKELVDFPEFTKMAYDFAISIKVNVK